MTTLAALTARVQHLEDIAAIKELKHRYLRACDLKQPDVVRDCFDPDGVVIDYEGFPPFDNREAFAKVYESMACTPNIVDIHHAANPEIDMAIGSDTAKAKWGLSFQNVNVSARTCIQMACEYNDEYIKKGGRWWIKKSQSRRTSFLMQKFDDNGIPTVLSFGNEGPKVFGEAPKK